VEGTLSGPFGITNLGPGYVTIGRSPDNQIVLNDPQASSHHAEVHADGTGHIITDLGSSNGTFVNSQRLAPNVPSMLRPGDVIRIGATEFRYETTSNPQDDATIMGTPGHWNAPDYSPTVSGAPDANLYGYNPGAPGYPPPPAYPQQIYPQPAQFPQQDYQQPTSYPQQGYPGQAPNYPNYGSPPQQPYAPPLQPGQYDQPQTDITAPGRPVRPARRSHVGLWITLIILLLIILGAAAGAYYYVNRSTPTKTLQAYCDAIKTGNASEAYNQLSTQAQSQTTQQRFTTSFNDAERLLNSPLVGGISDCTVSNVRENGSSATGTIVITVKNGGRSITSNGSLINENGTWKINNATRPATP
jgi:hypothetical protein